MEQGGLLRRLRIDAPCEAPGEILPAHADASVHREGEQCCLLDEPVAIYAPVRLLQGYEDHEVPWQTALRLSDCLEAPDVRVQLLKDGDHRLSSPEHLALIGDTLAELIKAASRIAS